MRLLGGKSATKLARLTTVLNLPAGAAGNCWERQRSKTPKVVRRSQYSAGIVIYIYTMGGSNSASEVPRLVHRVNRC
jgi:hypothetical protein